MAGYSHSIDWHPNTVEMGKEKGETETDVVGRIRDGDADAFEVLFKGYCQPLIYFARRFVHETETAENIVQDVFLKVWLNRSNLDPSLRIRSYLYTAVRNRALKHLRHAKVERRSAERLVRDNPGKSPEDKMEENEMASSVREAIGRLPDRCRIIFSMSRFDGLTYREIAEIMDISVKTVETQMGRALKFLRRSLSHLY